MPRDQGTIDALLDAMRVLRRHYDDRARGLGLTMSRARVISALSRIEGASQAELATELDIEAPTLKRLLDGLEADGFVTRRPMEGDARKNALFLTPRGRDSGIIAFGRQLRSDVVEGIEAEDLRRTRDTLRRIAANIARLSGK